MRRRILSRLALGLPPSVQPLSPRQRVLVLVLVFVFYIALMASGLSPELAIGVVTVLGLVSARIVAMLNRGDDVTGLASA
ncbi:hypothetical protein [Nocardia fluminea]|uniref:Uncharacterized protein n=1 Tax=Nocardia fluminea TaxID=134984 RepID=A0A2N3V570_9NOCA|nr:hypothetical protein [Nocardia fluminea]PKV76741.1 hypothetical protein ATK86_7143 [Nocardia fluminea]